MVLQNQEFLWDEVYVSQILRYIKIKTGVKYQHYNEKKKQRTVWKNASKSRWISY